MLTEIYIEALLVDENLADQVWEAWNAGKADDQIVCIAWMLIAGGRFALESGHYANIEQRGRWRPEADVAAFLEN